ncbi:MAG: hypothetical protein H0W66_13905 [Chthoniobacterales bacterium]|nr:hypothetical protein [Chthoniobacterales bacterium]
MDFLRRVPQAVSLLMALGQLSLPEPLRAQDAAPRDIRSDRATDNPIPLLKRVSEGVTFPVNLSTEVFGNLAGGTTRTAIWEAFSSREWKWISKRPAGCPASLSRSADFMPPALA